MKNIKNLWKDIIWLIELDLKNLKIKLFLLLGKNYSDPYRLLIKINDICNYRCVMCGIWKNNENNSFIPEKEQDRIIKKFENKLFFLSITGGEPFLQEKQLLRFVRKLKKANPKLRYMSINTNCSRPNQLRWFAENLLSEFPKLNIYVGLHYVPDEAWGKRETQVKEAYENYRKTRRVVEELEEKFQKKFSLYGKGFSFYNIITISRKEDFRLIREERDLWLGFAVISSEFYDNVENNYIEEIKDKEKVNIINKFLKINKKRLSFLNRRFLANTKKIFKKEKRERRCYAGVNRMYINSSGEIFICSRGIKKREDMSPKKCDDCWTSCEVNFDLLADFFLPSFLNPHKKDINS